MFPTVFDNTMVSAYRSCGMKHYWAHHLHLRRSEQSIHLTSGAAFARGLEITRKSYFDKGLSFDDSLRRGAAALFAAYGNAEPHPKHGAKDVWHIVSALDYYFTIWPIDRILTPINVGPKHAIEWNFSVPIPGIRHPETGDPLLYCGRFDMAAVHENGMRLGEDDKTTSMLGASWYERWRLANQILGYMWGANEHGLNLAGFNVRGVSLLKNGHGNAETTIIVNEWQIKRFVANLQRTIRKMIHDYQTKGWEYNFAGTCSAYGGCDYMPLCESPTPEDWIPIHYVEAPWNPLASRD